MSVLSIDFETRATVDLRKTGVYPYAEHPDTDIWCMAWAFDDEEPEIWTPTKPEHFDDCWIMLGGECDCSASINNIPPRILSHIYAGGEIRAWNAQFERIIWREIMVKRYGAPPIRDEQFVCSMAEAAAMSLPLSLDQCAQVLGITERKDQEGYSLMMRMTRPRKIHTDGRIEWWDVQDRLERLYAYCKQDVRVERAAVRALRRLTPRERETYLLDQRINDRGIRIDTALVTAAKDVADEGIQRANTTLAELTDGEVTSVTKNGALVKWLIEEGVQTESVAKAVVAELLSSDLSPDVRRVLEIRSEAGKSSLAKLDAMILAVCRDDRARGLLQYHAAGTGRWGGRLIQPQNFPRPHMKGIEWFIPLVLERAYDRIDLIEHPIKVIVSLLRSMMTADPGKELIAADFAAIECRVLNWLAGQGDVLKLFQHYDAAPTKAEKAPFDPYRNMAVKMGRAARPEMVSDKDRQAGKAAELGCGYQMGAEKFITAAWDVYQVRVSEEESEAAVKAYRDSHDKVVQFWREANDACIAAVEEPGSVWAFGGMKNLKATKQGAYLYIILPNGRPLCYARPKVAMTEMTWCATCGEKQKKHLGNLGSGGHVFTPVLKKGVSFEGLNSLTRKWQRQRGYGGFWVENIVQAVSRDLMTEALHRVEAAGYPPVLSVHDEVVSEVPEGFGDVKEYERLLAETPAWATGCPVAAEGWRGFRYRK